MKQGIIAKAVEKTHKQRRYRVHDRSLLSTTLSLPGFSTKQADLLSGRGVGMDIIKEAVIKSKGRIDTYSEPGKAQLRHGISTKHSHHRWNDNPQGKLFIIPIAVIMESINKTRNGKYR